MRRILKVLFLDIDGVLNNAGTKPESPQGLRDWLDEGNVRVLRRLVEETGAVVVLSSSWRLTNSIVDVAALLKIQIIGTTPSLGRAGREQEILEWLRVPPTEVESWIAIDDGWLDLEENRFYRVSQVSGLTDQDAAEIARRLRQGQSSSPPAGQR